MKKRTKKWQKWPKNSINRGGQLIFTIAIWKLTKEVKNPFDQNVNSGSYDGLKTLTLGPSKYKSVPLSFLAH